MNANRSLPGKSIREGEVHSHDLFPFKTLQLRFKAKNCEREHSVMKPDVHNELIHLLRSKRIWFHCHTTREKQFVMGEGDWAENRWCETGVC